jgi:hypothetical protein
MAHGRGLARNNKHRVTLVKYLHDVLPIGEQVHRYHPRYSDKCPSCDTQATEDRDHFWHCPAQSRLKWKQKCIRTMRDRLTELKTAPPLQELFLDQLRCILYNTNNSATAHPDVQHIANAQDAIGWRQLLKGRFSKSWAAFQTAYMGTRATAKDNGSSWITAIIDTLFKEWWLLWEMRNQDRHGKDRAAQTQASTAQALRDLQLFYETHQHDTPPKHKWLFDTPITDRMHWRTNDIQQWLNTWAPVLQESYTTALETA